MGTPNSHSVAGLVAESRTMNFSAPIARKAFTLAEVVIASAIGALTIGSVMYGYVMSARRAEWSGYSLAANSLAMQGAEMARACKWDLLGSVPLDELVATNFPMRTNILDIPISGTNVVWATNFTTIKTISTTPPLKMIRVDCVWKFQAKGPYTNTIVTYRAPDQ
jgi:hypothetical protein